MVVKIPLGLIKRIGKEFIPEFRISKDALLKLQDVSTDFIRVTLGDCRRLAEHAGRKTLDERDVILATE